MELKMAQLQEGKESMQSRCFHTIGQFLKNDQQPETILRRSKQNSTTLVAAHSAEWVPIQIPKDGQS
jgi:hypothetical protein